MAEPGALPGAFLERVEPDSDQTPRHLVRELGVVAGGDPEAADGKARHFRGAEDAILPERRGQRGGDGRTVELGAQVVDQHEARNLAQLGGDALAPFVVVAPFGHDARARPSQDRGDGIDHQRGPGAGGGLLDQVQRRRPVNHAAQEAQEKQGDRVRHFGGADEGEIAQQILAEQAARGSNFGSGRRGRNGGHREARCRGIEEPRIGVIAGLRDERAAAAEDRRVDDAHKDRQRGVGRRKDGLHHRDGRRCRDKFALAVQAFPVRQPCQHVTQPFLGDQRGGRAPLVVGHHPCRLSRETEHPRRPVRCHEKAPDPFDRPGEIALVRPQGRHVPAAALIVDRPVLPDLCGRFGSGTTVRRVDHRRHRLRS